MLCIVAIVGCTLQTYQHMLCYVLLLLSAVHYTHMYQHMLCIVAIVGCTLQTYQHMLCIVAIVGCTLQTYQHMLCIVAIVDCPHVHHVVQNIRTYHILLLLLTAPI